MRRFLCLLLALCLFVSLLAVPASATAVTTVPVDGLAAVAAMIAGTGVTINSTENFLVFNTLVNSVFDHLTASDIIDSAGSIAALVSGQKSYLPYSVIQSVKDYFYSSSLLSPINNTVSMTLGGYVHNFSSPVNLAAICYTDTNNSIHWGYYAYSDQSYYYYLTGVSPAAQGYRYPTKVNDLYIASDLGGGSTSISDTAKRDDELNELQSSGFTFIGYGVSASDYILDLYNNSSKNSVKSGFSLDIVSPVYGSTLTDNYPTWAESAVLSPPITLPGGTSDDEEIPYFPVSIPSYSVSTPALPPAQTDVWSGTYTPADTDPEPTEEVPVVPDVTGDIASGVTGIASNVKLIADYISTIKDSVVEWFTVTWAAFVTWLMDTLTAIKDVVVALPGLIVDAITAVGTTVKSIWDWLVDVLGTAIETIVGTLSDLLAWALGLVEALVAAFEALLVKIFVPDIASIKAAVADMRAQFPFFDAIIATGQYLVSGISSGEPPIIYIHLENAEGLYTWGNTVAVLDMSFYSRYKPAGDAIMSSALITFFAWRTLKHLPGILSGAASDSDVFKEI